MIWVGRLRSGGVETGTRRTTPGDARRAVSGGGDMFGGSSELLVWDLDKGGAPLLKLEGHADWVRTVACHGEGDDWCIVSGSRDGTVRLWDGAAGAVYPLGSYVASVALAPRAGEVDVFAAVGKSFARLALRAGPSQLEERIKEERPRVEEARKQELAARAVFRELPRLELLLPLLRTVAAVAPLLGLLGTVTGMIATFAVITEYGTGDPKRLSGGISQALITTELGLAVAIPTLLLHTLLDRWASRILMQLQTDSLVVLHDLACHRPEGHPHTHHHHHGDPGHHPGAHHTGPPA